MPQEGELLEQQAIVVCIPFEPQTFPTPDNLPEQQVDGMMNDHQIPHNEQQGPNIADVEDNNIDDHIHGIAATPIQAPVRKSQRVCKAITLPDFVYLNEAEYNVGDDDDPTSYHQAISSTRSKLWNEAMHEEL